MPIVLWRPSVQLISLPLKQRRLLARTSRRRFRTPEGCHDPCLLPRFPPMAEAMVAIALAHHWLRQK